MQKPSERHKLASDNNIIKFKKPVHDPFKEKKTNKLKTNVVNYRDHSHLVYTNYVLKPN